MAGNDTWISLTVSNVVKLSLYRLSDYERFTRGRSCSPSSSMNEGMNKSMFCRPLKSPKALKMFDISILCTYTKTLWLYKTDSFQCRAGMASVCQLITHRYTWLKSLIRWHAHRCCKCMSSPSTTQQDSVAEGGNIKAIRGYSPRLSSQTMIILIVEPVRSQVG